MDSKQKKRQRSANFTPLEVRLLIQSISKYKDIIENKRTDTVTNKRKEDAWEKVAKLFNQLSTIGTTRSAHTLKMKYEGLKKILKKKAALNHQQLCKKKGVHSQTPFSDTENEIMSFCSNIEGLESRHDSDFVEDDENKCSEEVKCSGEAKCFEEARATANVADTGINDQDNEVENRGSCSPQVFKTPISASLKQSKKESNKKTKFECLTDARLELVELQKKMLMQEIKYKRLEFEEKMKESEIRKTHLLNEEKRKSELHEANLYLMLTRNFESL